jgi:hypothetical protein
MVAITIIQPANGRPILTKIGQSSYNRQLTGVGRFNGTDASGTLIVPGLSQIAPGGIQLTPLQTLSQPTGSSFPIWYHLRHHHPYLHRPKDRNHQCRQLLHQGLITADDMNFWRFGILNKGTGNYVIAAPQIDSGASASATAKDIHRCF